MFIKKVTKCRPRKRSAAPERRRKAKKRDGSQYLVVFLFGVLLVSAPNISHNR
jgi:hypothetical protein